MKRLTYLACPYSHPNELVRLMRFHAVNKAAAALMAQGVLVFSPISHTHPIALAGDLPTDWLFWEAYDRAVLSCCERMIVLMLDGWKESKGVQAEIEIARQLGLGVEYLHPDN